MKRFTRNVVNRKDLTIRYLQFFDDSRKDALAPRWMEGVALLDTNTKRDPR